MNIEEAIEIISHHAGGQSSISTDKNPGLLWSLRPYKGMINENDFHDLIQSIYVVFNHYKNNKLIDKKIIHDIWCLCSTGKCWGVYETGMLKRNNLISKEDGLKLESWFSKIEDIFQMYLRDVPNNISISYYIYYIEEYNYGHNIDFFIPLIIENFHVEHLSNNSHKPDESKLVAIGKIGSRLKSLIPGIQIVLETEYESYEYGKDYFVKLCKETIEKLKE